MAKKGASYERELKGILSGDEKVINRFSKSLSEEEFGNYSSMIKKPFLVIRAAGSFGVDLIAIRGDFSFPIEVKSSSQRKLRFTQNSARAQEQAENLIRECERSGVIIIYAFRLKSYRGDPWRIFTIPVKKPLYGWAKYIYDFLPKIPKTREGNFILVWDDGMPLSKFLSYIN